MLRRWPAFLLMTIFFLLAGCAAKTPPPVHPVYQPAKKAIVKELPRMGYTIQVGAFAKVENASRLSEALCRQGLYATYFVAEKGLYKVRFGNFSTRLEALKKAVSFKASGIIDKFYIVKPTDYTVAKKQKYGDSYVREKLVKTAKSFIGVPYLWGGVDAVNGFDCSGLTMTVYQLNGLDLPRTSREQADTGVPVDREHLSKGDLVFFRTNGDENITHTGIYAGDDFFIHAPGKGKNIRLDSLSRRYYEERFAGGRSYL